MAEDKHWQLKAEGNPARKGLPALKEPTSKKAVAVRLYQSDDTLLRSMDVKSSDCVREAVRTALDLIRKEAA